MALIIGVIIPFTLWALWKVPKTTNKVAQDMKKFRVAIFGIKLNGSFNHIILKRSARKILERHQSELGKGTITRRIVLLRKAIAMHKPV